MSAERAPLRTLRQALDEARRAISSSGGLVAISGSLDGGAPYSLLEPGDVCASGEKWQLFDARLSSSLEPSCMLAIGEAASVKAEGEGRFEVVAGESARLFEKLRSFGPLAPRLVGGAGFEAESAVELSLPRLMLIEEQGRCAAIVVLDAEELARPDAVLGELAARFERRALSSVSPSGARIVDDGAAAFELAVAAALEAIEAGRLEKVVVARKLGIEARAQAASLVRRLAGLEATVRIGRAGFGAADWVAATPELLVERAGESVRSEALAGSSPRSGDDTSERAALFASDKDRREHELVACSIEEALRGAGLEPRRSELEVRSLRSVHHLRTGVRASSAHAPSALELAARLHPTPAMGGVPRGEALAFIARHESGLRGPYAAPFGWVDARGDGAFVVGIRGAEIGRDQIVLRVGTGIVRGSSIGAELAETEAKLAAMRSALELGQ
jgi:isochorismate synthase